jgi:hypothetical protein
MPVGDVSMGTPADFTDNDNAAAAHYSPEPDPLVLELCAGKGPPSWVNPMLEEHATSLVLIAEAPATGCPPALPLLKKWKHC